MGRRPCPDSWPRSPRRTSSLPNIIHIPSAQKADIYPAAGDPLHHWALERRQRHVVVGSEVWLAPPEYVIVRKLEWNRLSGSERHLRDVHAILEHAAARIDTPVLRRLVDERDLSDLLAAAERLSE